MGAEVGEVDFPPRSTGCLAYYIIGPAEASSNLARFDGIRYGHRAEDAEDVLDLYMRSRAEGFGPSRSAASCWAPTRCRRATTTRTTDRRRRRARSIIRDFEPAFANYDVLRPDGPHTAFKIGEKAADPLSMYLSDIFTIPVNLAGTPAVSMPCGCADTGLPVGLQLMGTHFNEEMLFRVAHRFEQATDFHKRRPEL